MQQKKFPPRTRRDGFYAFRSFGMSFSFLSAMTISGMSIICSTMPGIAFAKYDVKNIPTVYVVLLIPAMMNCAAPPTILPPTIAAISVT